MTTLLKKQPKLKNGEVETNLDEEQKRIKYHGFSGNCRKIFIYKQSGESDLVQATLGDLPTVNIIRGFEWIVPEEICSILDDATVETFEHEIMRQPDASGNVFKVIPVVKNRFQYRDMGPATWEEYEAFKAAKKSGK